MKRFIFDPFLKRMFKDLIKYSLYYKTKTRRHI